MTISVNTDLTGVRVAFVVPDIGGRINNLLIKAMQELLDRGIGHIKTISLEEASLQLAKTQGRHNNIPADQKYLKITAKGDIVQLFC